MNKVILTGASGFIGYHLLKKLIKEDIETWVILRENSPLSVTLSKIRNVKVVNCNLDNICNIPNIIAEQDFDAFFHLAWDGASGEARQNYSLQMDNAKWTSQCVEVAKKLKCKKIVITGTICERQCNEISLLDSFVKSSNYLLAKNQAREMALNVSKSADIPVIWCQFYHPIGVFNKKNQLITNTVAKVLNGETLLFGKCESLFDVIDVEDLVDALVLMAEVKGKSDVCFVGSGNPKPLKEYLLSIPAIMGVNANISFADSNRDDLFVDKKWLSVGSLNKEIGFVPSKQFQNSILDIRDWLINEDEYDAKKWIF